MFRPATLLLACLLYGCANAPYTVDDGRQVNPELLSNIERYGAGERALRPAILRSSGLKDAECDQQWELPFSVATSDAWDANDRVAWVRALGVDERLTVVGVAPGSPLVLRDKIQKIGRYSHVKAEKMLEELASVRDDGKAFDLTLYSGKTVQVKPFIVCRGYTRLAPPNTPAVQDYHWLMSVHPLQIASVAVTEDEALWAVLWTQGVSEEGGARMKTYHYGSKIVGTLYNVFTIATGLQGAALAANAAIKTAQTVAANTANEILKKQVMDQATSFAAGRLKDELIATGQKLTQQQAVNAMQQAAANRGALSGVARIAATVFEKADAWAYARMQQLGAQPLAGFSLHQKLLESGLTANSLVFDSSRMADLSKLAQAQGKEDEVTAILQGIRPDELVVELKDMPLASDAGKFSYDALDDPTLSKLPFAMGLIDGMIDMPLASAR
ncbi:MAG: hypothetical protein KAY82_05030 [Hylemonella sp.]|nr:hypothetical protein [Hylemonella sp.]